MGGSGYGMWIGLLGPLEVRNTTGTVHVTAPKHKSLLAALVIHAGNVVSKESLADAIWDGDWPARWPVTLRNYVKDVKNLLVERDRIQWRSPGYCLRLSPEENDLTLFDSLVKSGLAAASAGAWETASGHLRQAESLWRGTAFADVESRQIHTQHAHYLQMQRVTVTEARAEADIRLSRRGSAIVVPVLRRLIAEHPERERCHFLAMLALYRAGRQAEALGVYREARRHLAADHGIEPGPELSGMHNRILAADSCLLAEPLTDEALGLPLAS